MKKTSYYTEQTRILSNQTYTLFLLEVFDSIEMAAEKFVLIPKHTYIRGQPHTAQILLDNPIKHKKTQLSHLNSLRPLNESARTTTISSTTASATDTTVRPPTPEPPIVSKAENNPQKQALLLTSQDDDDGDEGNEMIKNAALSETLSTKRILLQLQLMDEHKLKRAKKSS